jgi:hypothetical protein
VIGVAAGRIIAFVANGHPAPIDQFRSRAFAVHMLEHQPMRGMKLAVNLEAAITLVVLCRLPIPAASLRVNFSEFLEAIKIIRVHRHKRHTATLRRISEIVLYYQ